MRLLLLFSLLTLQYGCVPNQGLSTSSAAWINVNNISKLKRGMTQAEVLSVMHQPYSDQVFVLDDATYDLWFYVTSGTILGQSRMMPANLTPLAFKDGRLIGWGKGYASYLSLRQAEIEKAKLAPPPPPPTPATEVKELENKPLENVLAPQNTSPTGPNQKPGKQKGQPKRAEPPLNLSPLEPQNPPPPNQQGQEGAKPKGPPPKPTGPDWAPLEQEPWPADQPPPPQQTTMSKPPEKKEPEKKDPKSVPLTDEDEEMLRKEQEQDFDQT
jgi:hypothetical protein